MFSIAVLTSVIVLGYTIYVARRADYTAVCKHIDTSISSVAVYYPGSPSYSDAISHWATSSIQQSACVVEPATPVDVGSILKVLGDTRTPFAVKGGGHNTNPGFSSTLGVQISMKRFSQVEYDGASSTALVGAGLIWDEVYGALDAIDVSVVGGRITGVGVAGFILGGGYSFKTNQYGLAIDNVVAFDLVLPSGEVIKVTKDSYPDLFFGLKGGFNNFGIVTSFVLKTHKQPGGVWGGTIFYHPSQYERFNAALDVFVTEVTDPKAAIVPMYGRAPEMGPLLVHYMFYDAPTPPPGIFDEFLAIPNLTADIGTRGMASLVSSGGNSDLVRSHRMAFSTVSVRDWTPALIKAVINETDFWSEKLGNKNPVLISYLVEPFLNDHLEHNTLPSAFPPDASRPSSRAANPMGIWFEWEGPEHDQEYYDAATASARYLKELVAQEQDRHSHDMPIYPNYATHDAPLESMYGDNLPALREIAKKYDPKRVMTLAGGFKFQ